MTGWKQVRDDQITYAAGRFHISPNLSIQTAASGTLDGQERNVGFDIPCRYNVQEDSVSTLELVRALTAEEFQDLWGYIVGLSELDELEGSAAANFVQTNFSTGEILSLNAGDTESAYEITNPDGSRCALEVLTVSDNVNSMSDDRRNELRNSIAGLREVAEKNGTEFNEQVIQILPAYTWYIHSFDQGYSLAYARRIGKNPVFYGITNEPHIRYQKLDLQPGQRLRIILASDGVESNDYENNQTYIDFPLMFTTLALLDLDDDRALKLVYATKAISESRDNASLSLIEFQQPENDTDPQPVLLNIHIDASSADEDRQHGRLVSELIMWRVMDYLFERGLVARLIHSFPERGIPDPMPIPSP